jgi:hypothetical protein
VADQQWTVDTTMPVVDSMLMTLVGGEICAQRVAALSVATSVLTVTMPGSSVARGTGATVAGHPCGHPLAIRI